MSYPTGGQGLGQLAVADFNGDGRPDLAGVNTYGNNVSVLLGQESGTFAAAVTCSSGGSYPYSLATGDLTVTAWRISSWPTWALATRATWAY